jgi:hypothetical protein
MDGAAMTNPPIRILVKSPRIRTPVVAAMIVGADPGISWVRLPPGSSFGQRQVPRR